MRAMWKGAISFGLVNIPVELYNINYEKEISFVLMHKKDHSLIRYARICKAEEVEVPWSDIVKAYEVEKGEYVILDEQDFEKADLKKSKTIEILQFIDEDEVDSMYYVKPYLLAPGKNAEKTYALLREALKKSKKVGLAKYVLRNHEHLAIIKLHENILMLNELRFQKELIIPKDFKVPAAAKAPAKELEMAVKLISQLSTPFDPGEHKDTYTELILKIIKQKAKGKPIQSATEEPRSSKVEDLMSLLQASLETKEGKSKQKTTSRSRKSA